MRIVCQQTILMKYHALFVIFEKAAKICNCRLLQIIGGALRVKTVADGKLWRTFLDYKPSYCMWIEMSIIDHSAPSCASQPISLHRKFNFWPSW